MIKKIVKVLLTVLLIVPSIAGLIGGGIAGYGEELPPEKASVTVHKKKMNSSVGPIQNTGDIMNEFDQYDGLENVEFNKLFPMIQTVVL